MAREIINNNSTVSNIRKLIKRKNKQNDSSLYRTYDVPDKESLEQLDEKAQRSFDKDIIV